MSKMNKVVKNKWVAALNSGNYKQGAGKLKYGNQSGTFHCCLGVLSELAVKEGVVSKKEAFSKDAAFPCEQVCDWAELTDEDPYLKSLSDGLGDISCSMANDKRNKSFKEIAAAIKTDL